MLHDGSKIWAVHQTYWLVRSTNPEGYQILKFILVLLSPLLILLLKLFFDRDSFLLISIYNLLTLLFDELLREADDPEAVAVPDCKTSETGVFCTAFAESSIFWRCASSRPIQRHNWIHQAKITILN